MTQQMTEEERYQVALEAKAKRERSSVTAGFVETGDALQRSFGMKVDPARLDATEIRELSAIVEKATRLGDPDEHELGNAPMRRRAWKADALDRKETKTLERLVEKGANMRGLFKQRRQAEKDHAELAEVNEKWRLLSRPQRPLLAGPGVVQLPAGLSELLTDETNGFGIPDLGLLAAVLLIIENRIEEPPYFVVEGDELVLDVERGFPTKYDDGQLFNPRRRQLLEYFASFTPPLLTLKRSGPEWRISRGPALLAEEKAAVAAVRA